jgi:hypothetical protein
MLAARLTTLSISLTLAACGPQPAGPASTDDPASTGGTPATDALPGTTTSDPTSTSSTTSTTSTSSTTAPIDTSTGSTTGDHELLACEGANRCEENEHCTPEARLNADIAGDTPLGPFKGTFAFASAAIAFGDLGNVYILPEYTTDLCAAAPMLLIELGETEDGSFEAPIAIDDGQGQLVQTTATVHISACCSTMWFCECENPSPYELEITVVGDGWSLAGTARPNCCRSHSIDEAA